MTTKPWADDTPEKLDASLRREQGDEMADFLAAFIHGDVGPEPGSQKRGRRPKRVGHKELKRAAIPQTRGTAGMTFREANEARQYLERKNWLLGQLRRMEREHGHDSKQARAAAERLRRHITE